MVFIIPPITFMSMYVIRIAFVLCIFGVLTGCKATYEWVYERELPLVDVHPIGLAKDGEQIWISDGQGNRLVAVDLNGRVLKSLNGFERPMHIDIAQHKIYIPEYASDSVRVVEGEKIGLLRLAENPDAPAGVAVSGNNWVVADFYNHRLIAQIDGQSVILGKQGKALGEFEYPTDVQFANGKLYIADAYNHRGQIFTDKGIPIKIFGEADKMNASTGIFVNEREIFLTDFEQNRVLVYDLEGKLKQVLTVGLNNPIEALAFDDVLWIANFKAKSISIYRQKKRSKP